MISGSHQVLCPPLLLCTGFSAHLLLDQELAAEIPRGYAWKPPAGASPTGTKGPQKLYDGTLVQLENLFSGHTMHPRLLRDLLALGTTPPLQLAALDITWRPEGQA